jgi:hypothetical protein
VAVRAEGDGMGLSQVSRLDKLIDELAGGTVEAQDRLELPGALKVARADIKVTVVRSEYQGPRLVQSPTPLTHESIDEGPSSSVVAQYLVPIEAAYQEVVVRPIAWILPARLRDGDKSGGDHRNAQDAQTFAAFHRIGSSTGLQ